MILLSVIYDNILKYYLLFTIFIYFFTSWVFQNSTIYYPLLEILFFKSTHQTFVGIWTMAGRLSVAVCDVIKGCHPVLSCFFYFAVLAIGHPFPMLILILSARLVVTCWLHWLQTHVTLKGLFAHSYMQGSVYGSRSAVTTVESIAWVIYEFLPYR